MLLNHGSMREPVAPETMTRCLVRLNSQWRIHEIMLLLGVYHSRLFTNFAKEDGFKTSYIRMILGYTYDIFSTIACMQLS